MLLISMNTNIGLLGTAIEIEKVTDFENIREQS